MGKASSFFVVACMVQVAFDLGERHCMLLARVMNRRAPLVLRESSPRGLPGYDSRAAKDHDRGADPLLMQSLLGLQKLLLQAQRPEALARQ